MSQFANNHQKIWAIHRRCQNEDLDIPRTVKQLLTYPQVVQQMIITHLIFLYDHYSPEEQNRYYYAAEIPVMSENESERCMFNLRQVVHALVHNDPHPEKHYKVKLNSWQQHPLHHFETLAPFPTWMTAEEDLFALMWGEEWHGGLELQQNYNLLNLPRLTTYARDFGLSFDELWFFIRSF